MVANATHPQRVDLPSLDVELALVVSDGAIVRQLTDYMRIANWMETIGSDHIAIEIHTAVFVAALRIGSETT